MKPKGIIITLAVLVVIAIVLFAIKTPDRTTEPSEQTTETTVQDDSQLIESPQTPINKPTSSQTKKTMETITTPSGLQYQVLTKGTGTEHPSPTSVVKVHYHGTLLDGTVFDSSVDRGEPIEFPLNAVIKGWQEGVQLMNVGDKFKFTIPANLAYGEMSPSPLIPANSTLVFEVELLGIK
jgi:peptidylprolyl isomerase